jgi:hypothetical protein
VNISFLKVGISLFSQTTAPSELSQLKQGKTVPYFWAIHPINPFSKEISGAWERAD